MKKKIYHPVIIDGIDFDQIIKEGKQQSNKFERDSRNESFNRNQLIQNKINLSGKDKYLLTLELIQEWVRLGKLTIPIKMFPFLSTEQQLLPAYLNELKSLGYFFNWYINPYKSEANAVFIFENVDLNMLNQLIQTKNNLLNNKLFWFNEKIFNIKTIDGSIRQVDFGPKKNENHIPDPFYLLKVLINIFRKDFETNQPNPTTKIKRDELIKNIKVDYPIPEKINVNWIKNTKRNLKSMIPTELKEIIVLSDFDRKTEEYIFTLKLPV